jgi:hypothetical protein
MHIQYIAMSTRFPSLTKHELHEIGQRRDVRDIATLLWEIARLRAVALRADQFLEGGDTNGMIRDALRRELDECACVQEQKATRLGMFKKG